MFISGGFEESRKFLPPWLGCPFARISSVAADELPGAHEVRNETLTPPDACLVRRRSSHNVAVAIAVDSVHKLSISFVIQVEEPEVGTMC